MTIDMNIDWNDITETARSLGLEPCALSAVCQVEAAGSGFLPDGRPKILFEGHIFWKELQKRRYNPAGLLSRADVRAIHGDLSDILYKNWTKKHYRGGVTEYSRLDRARAVNEEAALCSASWGAFQIMGFNYALCGYESVRAFVEDMSSGYAGQLSALAKFLAANNLLRPLKARDWAAFARGYNGAGYAQNRYDIKLKQAYEACAASRR